MSSSSDKMAPSLDDVLPALTIEDITVGHTLQGNNSAYTVLEFLGEGVFGKVAKCLNVQTNVLVAVKILLDPNAIREADREVSMLEALSILDSETYNVVKFFGRFNYRGLTCLAFEILEINIYDFIERQEWQPLSPSNIRPIAKQLLVTLDGLKGLGVIHTDLKLDNIMFPKVKDQPFRVKVIDFGEAMYASDVRAGMWAQPCGLRAPEVSLGNKFNESIDVFSLGFNLAFLYLAYHLFPVECDYQMVKRMVEILGYPPDYLLSNGVRTKLYFKEVVDEETWSTTWTLRTPEEYEEIAKTKTEPYNDYGCDLKSLDDLLDAYPKWEDEEYEDRKALVDLLKGLLNPDPCLRLSPKQALQHRFITMSHLDNSTKYFEQSQQVMQVCPAFEDVSVPEEEATTLDPPKDLPPLESLNPDDWCVASSPEALIYANPLDRAEGSCDWDNGVPDEYQSFSSPFWCEETDVLHSTGLGKLIWSLEDDRSDDPAHCSQFEDWWSDAGSDDFPNKEDTESKRTVESTATQDFLSLDLLDSIVTTIPERISDQDKASTKKTMKDEKPGEKSLKYDTHTGTNREEAGSNMTETQEFLSLDLLNRNATAIVTETRDGNQDKAKSKTSVKNVQPKEQFIKYDALTGIWSTDKEEVGSKRIEAAASLEIPSPTVIPDTTVISEGRRTLPEQDRNNAAAIVFDKKMTTYNLPPEDEDPRLPVEEMYVFVVNICLIFRCSIWWPLFRGRVTISILQLNWDPGKEQGLVRERSST